MSADTAQQPPVLESNTSSSHTEDTATLNRPLTRHYLVNKLSATAYQQQPEQEEDNKSDHAATSDQNYQFYKEYCRLYYANIILTNRLQQLLNEKQDLQFKLNRLEVTNI